MKKPWPPNGARTASTSIRSHRAPSEAHGSMIHRNPAKRPPAVSSHAAWPAMSQVRRSWSMAAGARGSNPFRSAPRKARHEARLGRCRRSTGSPGGDRRQGRRHLFRTRINPVASLPGPTALGAVGAIKAVRSGVDFVEVGGSMGFGTGSPCRARTAGSAARQWPARWRCSTMAS